MKPIRTLLFLFSVFFVLFLIAWVFPENGLQLGRNIHLKFADLNDFLEVDTVQYADISSIIENTRVPVSDKNMDSLFQILSDSVSIATENLISTDTLINPAESHNLSYSLEFPDDDVSVLYPFFRKLAFLKSQKRLVRILHYGDSQIEADRMSSFIRNKLQLSLGGSGCGTVPVVPLYNGQLSIKQEYSENWERITGYANQDSTIEHKRYGALMSFVRQSFADSLSGNLNNNWLKFETSPIAYPSSRKYSDVSLYIEGEENPVNILVTAGDSIVDSVILKPATGLKKLKWHFRETPDALTFYFTGQGSANIYGISMDNSWGVALDNIPLRGSSGLVFSKTDTAFLGQMYRMMDVGMIILQFGGNVVPYMTENYSAYGKYFKRELMVIKKMLPGVPVIVIGPSDMSIKEKDKYITYPNLEGIRDVMRTATLESGFVFWDMYGAMGGRNSMPSWVMADPPLAVSDYVHFNTRGAKIIAEMFSNALMNEYNSWLLNTEGTN